MLKGKQLWQQQQLHICYLVKWTPLVNSSVMMTDLLTKSDVSKTRITMKFKNWDLEKHHQTNKGLKSCLLY